MGVGEMLTLRSYGRVRRADRFVKETRAEGEGWAVPMNLTFKTFYFPALPKQGKKLCF